MIQVLYPFLQRRSNLCEKKGVCVVDGNKYYNGGGQVSGYRVYGKEDPKV